MDGNFEQARTFFLEGVAHYEAGRLAQAERQFAAALALVPGRPSVLTNLGAVRLKLGRPEEALALLEEAIAQEPGNTDALGHAGAALAELGEPLRALDLFDRALALDPALPTVWMLRGSVLKDLGRPDEAAASLRESLARGGDEEVNRFYLAALQAEAPPPSAPRRYVQALFDGYAAQFDEHLVEALRYGAPRRLLDRWSGRRFAHALDLGCGTGLCGPLLRPLAQRVTGVDLSAAMLERARQLGAYDALVQEDVLAFLQAAPGPFDAVVAADVFIYVGMLDAVFARLAELMPAGGAFCFTVEESEQADLVLRPTLRYAHSEASLRRLAAAHGFRVTALERAPVREDQQVPVPALFVWLEKA